jgi:hypothetical protein
MKTGSGFEVVVDKVELHWMKANKFEGGLFCFGEAKRF